MNVTTLIVSKYTLLIGKHTNNTIQMSYVMYYTYHTETLTICYRYATCCAQIMNSTCLDNDNIILLSNVAHDQLIHGYPSLEACISKLGFRQDLRMTYISVLSIRQSQN